MEGSGDFKVRGASCTFLDHEVILLFLDHWEFYIIFKITLNHNLLSYHFKCFGLRVFVMSWASCVTGREFYSLKTTEPLMHTSLE